MERLRVAVVGATGIAGQQFVAALASHPWFELVRLAASARSAGKPYREALRDSSGATAWYASERLPDAQAELLVEDAATLHPGGLDLVFTGVESDAARELEPRLAARVPVISTASAYRMEPDVPLLLPGVNFEHAALLASQRRRRGCAGFIVPIPNCTTTGLAITLRPLDLAFGVERVIMTSLQACSGAGRSPGVIALDILDNVIPYIAKEEEKVQAETRKILGRLRADGEGVEPAAISVSCTCTRVAVIEGHTEAVFVGLGRRASLDEVRAALRGFGEEMRGLGLPSAPPSLIVVRDDPFRPQPRLDRDEGGGMSTVVGRLREDGVLERGIKYVLVSHNTRMGAARGALLTAEYLHVAGYLRS